MANTIVWFDLPVANLERATYFYSCLLDIELKIHATKGFKMTVFPHSGETNDVAGCLYEKLPFEPNKSDLLIYFDVNKRLKQSIATVITNGGEIAEPINKIGEHGYRAVILDSEGNKIALHALYLE